MGHPEPPPEPPFSPPVAPGSASPWVSPTAPPSRRTYLWFGLVVALVLVLVAGAAVTAGLLLHRRSGPRSGDLVMTLSAVTGSGQSPAPDDLRRARQVLLDRLDAAEYQRPHVDVVGAVGLSVRVGRGSDPDALRRLVAPGRLGFRMVLATGTGKVTAPPGGGLSTSTDTTALARVRVKLGTAYETAVAVARGEVDPADPATAAKLAPFGSLSGAEVAVLPPELQYAVPTVTCGQLDQRPAGAVDGTSGRIGACDDQHEKYYLDVPKTTADDVRGARAGLDQSGDWSVTISFTDAGQKRWTDLTREAVAKGTDTQVAIVMDNLLLSAPTIQQVITGDAQIAGGLDATAARTLAAQLTTGPLPVNLKVDGVTTVR